ncbi:hypothetical protein FA15DRAFT_666625 [Coprinopsis marcescibilis]|uniref:Uncharacterized protein n=1 Tax=Coprinopsis marcescibilis TaxID=230819 RepID=A0A5C3L297_COPMA|nr:hypothetical protein FA15DRAFT_666625 [Coprinopsis marcescibilis]
MSTQSMPNIAPLANEVFEYSSRGPEDGLYLERLESFMDKCLAEIKAFSEREMRPFDETRRSVAEWHAKYLFQPQMESSKAAILPIAEKRQYVRSVLMDTSRILETLAETSGTQSFFLAVDPPDPLDHGFLGGSLKGREFWRSLRYGGEHGAKAFKQQCLKSGTESDSLLYNVAPASVANSSQISQASSSNTPARTVKAHLYDTVRKALRSASGIRNAEMKWTNPERLDTYNVRLVGWPEDIPFQNPSCLKTDQNRRLLESFKSGTTKFHNVRMNHTSHPEDQSQANEDDDFSWAFDPNGGSSPDSVGPENTLAALPRPVTSTAPSVVTESSSGTGSNTREATPSENSELFNPWNNLDPSVIYEHESNPLDWRDEQTRSRKRPRNEDDNVK